MFIQLLFFALSLILTLLFFLYAFGHYYLLNAARSYRPPVLPERSTVRPSVSIQLPIYNERYVIRRLVAACAVMAEAYGIDKVTILVLDDSDDDTVLRVDEVVEEYRKKYFQIEVLRRGNRVGFKAGALQAALDRTEEEFIAIFDADFVPPADFLVRSLPYFEQNESLGIIQGRWGHLNQNYNLLTQAIGHYLDAHFFVEQPGRYAAGCFQSFDGSGGLLRKRAILDAGGWRADTLTEDLDLSYRMQIIGYRILYLRDLVCPGEIPPTIPSFKQQQGRWACGSLRNARKILPGLLRDRKIGLKQRWQAFFHLTAYILHPLMVMSFLLSCLSVLLGLNVPQLATVNALSLAPISLFPASPGALVLLQNLVWLFLAPFIVLCTLAPWVSLVSTLKIQGLPLARNLPSIFVLFMLSIGLSLSNMREAGKALFTNRSGEFTRTPKYADVKKNGDWRRRQYQIPLDHVWFLELAFAILGFGVMGIAIQHSNFTVLFVLTPFALSNAFVFALTIAQSGR